MTKNIGKPCTGKPYARFDEGGPANSAMLRLMRGPKKNREGMKARKWVLKYQQCLRDICRAGIVVKKIIDVPKLGSVFSRIPGPF